MWWLWTVALADPPEDPREPAGDVDVEEPAEEPEPEPEPVLTGEVIELGGEFDLPSALNTFAEPEDRKLFRGRTSIRPLVALGIVDGVPVGLSVHLGVEADRTIWPLSGRGVLGRIRGRLDAPIGVMSGSFEGRVGGSIGGTYGPVRALGGVHVVANRLKIRDDLLDTALLIAPRAELGASAGPLLFGVETNVGFAVTDRAHRTGGPLPSIGEELTVGARVGVQFEDVRLGLVGSRTWTALQPINRIGLSFHYKVL